MPLESLLIRSLTAQDASIAAEFLQAQDREYMRFFYAFGTEENALSNIFSAAERDVYSGIFWRGRLAAVFMLRGWDEGYEVPAFGVVVDQKYRGGAFMRLALDSARLISRLSGAKRLMAKIHPNNVSPRGASRLGLRQTGVEESTGNIIYHMEL